MLGGTGVLLLVSLIGVPRLDFALSARTILGNESDLFATIDTLDELGAGGGLQIELLYTNENPGGVITDAGSARLAEISEILDRTRIGGEPLFVEAHVGDLLDLAAATQPTLGAEELAELLRSADTFGNLDALVTSDDEAARITLSASFISNTDLAREAEPLQAEFDALAGPGERIRLTGTGLAAGISAESTFPDIVRSYALALGIVAALVALAVRSLGRGLVSMVPNLLPAVLLAGAMGLAGIPISMMTIVVGAVLIGVSVDDTVHVVHATFIADGGSNQPKAVVAQTMRETGPALSLTSAIVTLGLITFALMPLVGLRQIAWLGALAIALALAADVIVLPALIALISRDRDGVSPE